MARKLSILAPDWWDYTTLDEDLLIEAARLSHQDMIDLGRTGFKVIFFQISGHNIFLISSKVGGYKLGIKKAQKHFT